MVRPALCLAMYEALATEDPWEACVPVQDHSPQRNPPTYRVDHLGDMAGIAKAGTYRGYARDIGDTPV